MVILYGHMSRCDRLPKQTAIEDVWLALDMLPRFRWRWERKDFNGGHPLIAKLAERVMEVNLSQVGPTAHPVLLSEQDWETDDTTGLISPSMTAKSQQSTPTLPNASPYSTTNGASVMYGPPARGATNGNGTSGGTPPGKHLVDVPTGLFYPFYPETQLPFSNPPGHVLAGDGSAVPGPAPQHDYTQLLAAAAAAGQPDGSYGCQPSQDSFMSEERDHNYRGHPPSMQMWMNVVSCCLL